MDELETKVAEAIWEARRSPEQSPWAVLHPSVRDGVLTGARAAIAAMREHSGGGYEAAARECERLAVKADKDCCACEDQGSEKSAARASGETHAYRHAASIIREHEQHARPVVDREGLARAMDDMAATADASASLSGHDYARRDGQSRAHAYRECAALVRAHLGAQPAAPRPVVDGELPPEVPGKIVRIDARKGFAVFTSCDGEGVDPHETFFAFFPDEDDAARAIKATVDDGDDDDGPLAFDATIVDAVLHGGCVYAAESYDVRHGELLAHLGAQPAAPTTCANCRGTDITPPRCETCGARGDELAQPAAVPASEPFREAVRLGDEPGKVDAPGVIAALRARTASEPAPAASEHVTTAMLPEPGTTCAVCGHVLREHWRGRECLRAPEPAPAASEPVVTDAMVSAYLEAHTEAIESEPVTNPNRDRLRGVKAGLRAAMAAAPAASEPVVTHELAGAFDHAAHQCRRSHDGVRRACCTYAGLRAALAAAPLLDASSAWARGALAGAERAMAAAPQRAREAGEAEALAVFDDVFREVIATDVTASDILRALRAAGLRVAVPDTEWAALVAERDGLRNACEQQNEELGQCMSAMESARIERDGLRKEVEALKSTRPVWNERVNGLTDKLAAATKRAEEAESEVARWRDSFRGNPPEACRANYDALAEGLTAAQTARDAAEARVRELKARPVVVDAGARKALEALARMYDAAGDRQAAQSIRAGLNWEG